MADDKTVSTTISEALHRRFKARTADLNTSMSAVLRNAIIEWVGDWGLNTVEYTVRQGDTLARIASRFYDDASKYRVIAYFNHIADLNLIQVGQVLLIPEPTRIPEEPAPPVLRDDESPFLYGIHDPGGEHLMRQAGVTGWILYTTLVNEPPQDFAPLTDEGFGMLVRLNWGYNPNGTLPHDTLYQDFADLCAQWVRQSRGVTHWIIANEPNLRGERPGFGTPEEQPITPRMYATAFRQCRTAIRNVAGHEDDQIITAAVAPWNVQTGYSADPHGAYDANPTGNWIEYFRDMLRALEGDVDGIALHAYTHRVDLNTGDTLITSEITDWPHLFPETGGAHSHFRAYQDFMHAIPASMRHLPVYITETNQDSDNGATWFTQNLHWVQDAYAEINRWNQHPAHQKIRALLLYRWRREAEGGDKWGISGNEGVKEDFQQALQHRYRWV
ncbi:MAG: LysM peptidoglycan-binding domain-containing protein [Anaerolineae bacterium]